jgi:ribosomal protein L11 methylase PrmA
MNYRQQESSFRDPAGFLFFEGGTLLRQVSKSYQQDFELLMESGLYKKLISKQLLISHKTIENHPGFNADAFRVIEPEYIDFISYPYEWSFSQLKDAAMATLEIQNLALRHGMTLKDASAYNIQFHRGKPVFIDTLSFEKYREGSPWEAYRQFCQHFLAPLALMSQTDIRMNQLLKIYLDGIPLDLASRLLPGKTKWNFSLLMHIHLHAKAQKKYEHRGTAAKRVEIKKHNLLALIQGLQYAVKRLHLRKQDTEWGEYYTFTNYSDRSFVHKKEIIAGFIGEIKPRTVWDLGANTGEFTRIAAQSGAQCVAFDIDPLAVNANYLSLARDKTENMLPLVLDLTNPSPAIGWNNEERENLKSRPLPDVVMALALIHHLAISNNLPFSKISHYFSELSNNLIIEFVPKQDSQVMKLLESRKDIFPGYNEESFIAEFGKYFEVMAKEKVMDSERTIFRMVKKS